MRSPDSDRKASLLLSFLPQSLSLWAFVTHKLFQSYLLLFEVQKAEGFPTLSLYLFPIHREGEILEV